MVSQRGIFSALSPSTPDLIIKAMQKAKDQGAVVSFDSTTGRNSGNPFPTNLKNTHRKSSHPSSNMSMYCSGMKRTWQLGLGLKGPEVVKADKLDPTSFYGMMESVQKRFPTVKAVATTML